MIDSGNGLRNADKTLQGLVFYLKCFTLNIGIVAGRLAPAVCNNKKRCHQ